jgi:hypothetical protein
MIVDAECTEMNTLIDMGAFLGPYESLPEGVKGDKLLWVYRAKPDENGLLAKIKARLTLRGDLQRLSFEGKDASAPVMEWSTLKLLMSIFAKDPTVMWAPTWDITAAYLSASMRRSVFVQLPREHAAPNEIGKWWLVVLALYGGLDSGRCFYDKLIAVHEKLGFTVGTHDKCYLYKVSADTGEFIRLCTHVDDAAACYKGKAYWQKYLTEVGEYFTLKVSEFRHFLGVRICRRDDMAFELDLDAQVDKMLRAFHMDGADTKKETTPVASVRPTLADVPDTDEERARMSKVPYRQLVGHLTYLWVILHPEISYPLKIAAQFADKPGRVMWNWVKHIARFLKSKASSKTIIRGVSPEQLGHLSLWTDSDHARCQDTRKSISGNFVLHGNDVIHYAQERQDVTALNTAEAETMSATFGGKNLAYIRHKLIEVTGMLESLVPIAPHLIDCSAVISVGKNPVQPGRNRHMHAKYFYYRELHKAGITCLTKIPSKDNMADLLVTYKDPSNFHNFNEIVKGHKEPNWPELADKAAVATIAHATLAHPVAPFSFIAHPLAR